MEFRAGRKPPIQHVPQIVVLGIPENKRIVDGYPTVIFLATEGITIAENEPKIPEIPENTEYVVIFGDFPPYIQRKLVDHIFNKGMQVAFPPRDFLEKHIANLCRYQLDADGKKIEKETNRREKNPAKITAPDSPVAKAERNSIIAQIEKMLKPGVEAGEQYKEIVAELQKTYPDVKTSSVRVLVYRQCRQMKMKKTGSPT